LVDTLPFRTLAPFGVEVTCDLAEPLSPARQDHFRALFNRHSLILARGQALSMERQREICSLLGPILDRPGEDGYMSNEGGGPSTSALTWHSDAAYTEHPFDALSLHALDVVGGASDTRFVSAQDACDTLPASLRNALAGQQQEMIAPHYTRLAERTCDQRDPEAQKRGILPAIHINPHTDRACLWVSELQTVRLLGMEWEASRDLLHAVFDHLYAPEKVFEHRWCNGDFIVWDNIALQHTRGNLEHVGKRLLQRAIVGTHGVAPHIDAAEAGMAG
jgi:taurine dioxygenase